MVGLALVLVWGAFGYWGGLLAVYKGYRRIVCIPMCTPFGPLSLIIVFLLPPTADGRDQAAADQQVEQG